MSEVTRKQRRQIEQKQRKIIRKLEKIAHANDVEDNSPNPKAVPLNLPKMADIMHELAGPLCGENDADAIYDIVSCCWNIGGCDKAVQELLWGLGTVCK